MKLDDEIRRSLRWLGVRRKPPQPFGCYWWDDVAALVTDIEVIFDVGANVGQTIEDAVWAYPKAQIYSFEPAPSSYHALAAATVHLENVQTFSAAIGAAAGSAEITDTPLSVQNTIRDGARPGAPRVSVPVITIDNFLTEHDIKKIDLLKIDTEGYELEVLAGAQDALAQQSVRLIMAECEFVPRPADPHTSIFDLTKHLAPLGYRPVCFYTAAVDDQGWVWGDALFKADSVAVGRLYSARKAPWSPIDYRPRVLRS